MPLIATLLGRAISRENLPSDCRGVAAVEFALATPLVLLLGLTGTEMANLVLTHLRISQAALALADNASRVGVNSDLSAKQVQEREVNEVLRAADVQAGELKLLANGRVVLSSLQVNGKGGQTITWQRCRGALRKESSYGKQGDGANNTSFKGMGSTTAPIKAVSGSAVMFVEVWYDYQPIITPKSLVTPQLHYTAAFTVRDKRDLSGLYNPAPAAPVSSCDIYVA